MSSLCLRSPAKLNLYLKVVNKREDGYHNLKTIFERINLFDDIELTLNQDGCIRILCDHPDVPLDSLNFVYKAAQLLKDDFALQEGVDISITKRIPVAAGLAGGSSNAATVLLGLNRLWKLDLNSRELLFYARTIGSDVPFFLYDCSWALGLGRGDKIKKLMFSIRLWHILVVPPLKMYSKDVFAALNLELTKQNDDGNILTRCLRNNDISALGNLLYNDLESTIVKLSPALHDLKKELLGMTARGVSFSGSGPAVFGLTQTQQEAEDMKAILQKHYKYVFAVRTF